MGEWQQFFVKCLVELGSQTVIALLIIVSVFVKTLHEVVFHSVVV